MTDQIREALFSALGSRVVGARWLDLYAGSGSVGIEALSRGAAHATFVERDPRAVATIRSNLETTGLGGRAEVIAVPVESFLAGAAPVPYQIVMIDPPFRVGLPSGVVEALAGGFLAPEAVVVVRVSSRLLPIDVPDRFEVVSKRRYGDSTLIYMSAKEEAR